MHIQVCHTSSHTTVCKQEVHFKKRLKAFRPLGSANGDGAGEGKNSRQRRNLQARKQRVSGKILACEQALLFGRVKQVAQERARPLARAFLRGSLRLPK